MLKSVEKGVNKKFKLIEEGGGDETRLKYMRYVPAIQADVPARTTCRHSFYKNQYQYSREKRYVYTTISFMS